MNTRGSDKNLFATDFPFLPFDRALESARALPSAPACWRNTSATTPAACSSGNPLPMRHHPQWAALPRGPFPAMLPPPSPTVAAEAAPSIRG